LNGDDLRRDPLQVRKATLASIVAKARPGIRFNEHIEGSDVSQPQRTVVQYPSERFLEPRAALNGAFTLGLPQCR
jgi:hypothetical protein